MSQRFLLTRSHFDVSKVSGQEVILMSERFLLTRSHFDVSKVSPDKKSF